MRKKALVVIAALLLIAIGITIAKTSKFYPILFQLLFNREIQLKSENNNINILLLGIGGGIHEGPDLTDTIMFASVDQKKDRVFLLSIPRDLWIPQLQAKVNLAYAVGQSKRKGGGIVLIRSVIEKILGVPIDYVVRIDFDGFEKTIDLLDGVDVNVQSTFDDYEYPVFGKEDDPCGHSDEEAKMLATASSQLDAFPCRYIHIRFDKGQQHMSGKQALEFVRSRHAKGEEGTDFARNKRQEEIIKAAKNKIFSVETLLNPAKVFSLYGAIKNSLDTNIKEEEFDDFIRLAKKMENVKIESVVLDYGDKGKNRPGLLMNPPISEEFDNQWVLIPRIGNGNFSEIQKYVDCEIKIGNCVITTTYLQVGTK